MPRLANPLPVQRLCCAVWRLISRLLVWTQVADSRIVSPVSRHESPHYSIGLSKQVIVAGKARWLSLCASTCLCANYEHCTSLITSRTLQLSRCLKWISDFCNLSFFYIVENTVMNILKHLVANITQSWLLLCFMKLVYININISLFRVLKI
jgi:hypothetical protein